MSMQKLRFMILAVVILLITSNTWAANITYNFVDYPLDEAKNSGAVQCWLSGTIVTDGTLGDYVYTSHIVSVDFSISSASFAPWGSFPADVDQLSGSSAPMFYATSSSILVPSGYGVSFFAPSNVIMVGNSSLVTASKSLRYDRYGESEYRGSENYDWAYRDYPGEPWQHTYYNNAFGSDGAPQGYGSIGNNDPWVIATVVPEPSTIALLLTATLGGLLWWRRRF
jgi:hypothetical protein